MNSSEWYTTENQNFVASCYTYLVDQMHTALNTKLDVRLAEEASKLESSKELWFRSEEAYEFEDYEKTDKLITKVNYCIIISNIYSVSEKSLAFHV